MAALGFVSFRGEREGRATRDSSRFDAAVRVLARSGLRLLIEETLHQTQDHEQAHTSQELEASLNTSRFFGFLGRGFHCVILI
jgi:hypothetical protein